MSAWPVVVVTGANCVRLRVFFFSIPCSTSSSGVGFGICRRLLFQLCISNPPDSWPQPWAHANEIHGSADPLRHDGLTLIMACRSTQRAETARTQLYKELDAHIDGLRARPGYDGHADTFRLNLKIEVEYLDLAVLSTVFNFAAEMAQQHTHISHLIFNAGVANFTNIDWPICLGQLASNFLNAITKPEFYVQSVGEVSNDGFGWIWQSNLFGHYVLFRALEPLLNSSTYPADSRVIWSSSLEASPKFYDKEDWQLTKTAHSYEGVKYQIDLVATILDRRALKDPAPLKRIRHFISHPGVCHTKISTNLVAHGGLLDTLKVIAFYVGRIVFGSRHHPISSANAAVAAVHLILVSISFITFSACSLAQKGANGNANGRTNGSANGTNASAFDAEPVPVRFGAETDRWGNPQVGTTPVQEWRENKAEGEALLAKCEAIYSDLSEKRAKPVAKS
ncbi:hypothetical protein DFH09DRAFT_1156773 [Mycena vulgaris]|nr:hypothetical protein DFH09DRAFT_1156773 [Mycena vulgaris]